MGAFRMPSANGGLFRPRVKFNAKAGRVYRIDRVQQADGWGNEDVEITAQFAFYLALESFADGWWNRQTFKELLGPLGGEMIAQPDERDAAGKPVWAYQVRCTMKLAAAAGGDLRVFSSGAQCVLEPLDKLYSECMSDPKARGDQLRLWVPAVRMARTEAIKGDNGVNYAPVFELVKWVQRPADMPYEPVEAPEPLPASGAAAAREAVSGGNGAPQSAGQSPAAVVSTVAADDPNDDASLPF